MNKKGVGNFTAVIPEDFLEKLFGACNSTKITLFNDESSESDYVFNEKNYKKEIENLQHLAGIIDNIKIIINKDGINRKT